MLSAPQCPFCGRNLGGILTLTINPERRNVTQVRDNLQDLRELLNRTLTVRQIAEPLISFDETTESASVSKVMKDRGFDVVGIRREGEIVGYVHREDLEKGDHIVRDISGEKRLPDSAGMAEVFEKLVESDRVFVEMLGEVAGIVTHADLQKIPLRMWMFGLVSLTEMQMLRLIRLRFPKGEEWPQMVTDGQLKEAKYHFKRKKANNEEIDLIGCLGLPGKARIFQKDDKLKSLLTSKISDAVGFFNCLRGLRNSLAHDMEIAVGGWRECWEQLQNIQDFLGKLEGE
jgi:predicted transcriptional regulator